MVSRIFIQKCGLQVKKSKRVDSRIYIGLYKKKSDLAQPIGFWIIIQPFEMLK